MGSAGDPFAGLGSFAGLSGGSQAPGTPMRSGARPGNHSSASPSAAVNSVKDHFADLSTPVKQRSGGQTAQTTPSIGASAPMRTSWSTTPRDSPRGPGPADSPVGARQHIPRSGSAFSATSPLSDLASLTVGTLSRSSLNGAGAPMRSPRGGSSANSPHVPTHAHSASEAPGGAPSPALRDHGGDPSPKRTEEDLLDRSKPAEAPSPRGHATDPFPAVPPPAHAGQAHADDSDPFGGLFGAFPAEPRPAAAAVAGAGPSGRPPEEAGKAVPRCDHGSDLIPGFGAATADQPVVTHRTAADSAPTAAAAPALSTTSRTREAHTSAVRAPEPAATSPTSPAAASQRPHSHDGPRGGQQGAVLGAASTGTRVMSGAGAGVPNRGADTPGAGAGTHNRGEHIPIAGAGTASGPRSQGAVGAGRVATGGQFWEQMPRRDPMGSSMGAPAAGYGGGNPAGALRSEVVGGRAVGGEDRNVASPSAPGSSGHGIKGFWTKAKDLGHKAAQSARRIASDLKSHVESGVQAGATLFDKQRKPAQLEVAPAAIQEAVALYGMREGDRTAALGAMDPEQRDTVLYIMDIITVSGGVIPRSTLGPTGLPRTVDIDPMRPPPYPTPPHASHPISPTRVAPADFYATASAQAAVPTQGASQGLQPQRQAHQQRPHAQPQMQQRQQRPGHDAAHRQTGPSQGVYGRQEAHGTAPEGLAASQRSIPAVSTARGPVAASAAPNLQTPSSAPVPAPASPAAAPSPRGPPGSASPRPAGPSQPVADLLGTSPPQPAPAAPRHTPPASPASGSQQQTPAASAPPPAAAPSQGADGGLDIFSGSGSQAAVPVGDLFDIHGDADASAHAGLDMDEGILGMFAAPLEPAAADSNSIYTDDSGFQRQPGEPEERWRARVARLKAERESVAKALREQQKRDQEEAQLKEEAYERKRELRSEVEAWKAASKGNVRALLGSLDKILWEGSGWKGVAMSDLIDDNKVKLAYRKALLLVHPDRVKNKGGGVEEVARADMIFDALKEAWAKFGG